MKRLIVVLVVIFTMLCLIGDTIKRQRTLQKELDAANAQIGELMLSVSDLRTRLGAVDADTADKIATLDAAYVASHNNQEIRILILTTAVRDHVGDKRWDRYVDRTRVNFEAAQQARAEAQAQSRLAEFLRENQEAESQE